MPNSTLPPDNYLGDPERTTGEFQDRINQVQNWINALQAELNALSGTTLGEAAVRSVNGGSGPLRANLEPTSNVEFNRVTAADFMQATRFKSAASPGDGDFDSDKLGYWEGEFELGGDFESGASVYIVRVGRLVAIQSVSGSHGVNNTGALKSSSTGAMPSWATPDDNSASTLHSMDGNRIFNVSILNSGTLQIYSRDWNGDPSGIDTAVPGVTIAYYLDRSL